MTSLPVPSPNVLHKPGGSLWFAAGSPTGWRSSTWAVVGGGRARDVYVGARQYMGVAKLSLHASGSWRYAYTHEFANVTNVGDRLIRRLTPPPLFVTGWRRAATVIVPMSSLRPPFPEKMSRRRPVSWWPATGAGRTIRYEIFVSDPEPNFAGEVTIDCIGEVGRIPLPGGGGVWVLADESDFRPWEDWFQDKRRELRASVGDARCELIPHPAALLWTTDDDDGHPVLYDLGDLSDRRT